MGDKRNKQIEQHVMRLLDGHSDALVEYAVKLNRKARRWKKRYRRYQKLCQCQGESKRFTQVGSDHARSEK